ncbi:MAG: isoleucine--tRNA ligase [Acutalibacteraceae bacterium]|nr:isoleucine--tRNA ligase [Acutalibacteraceae bacterium]
MDYNNTLNLPKTEFPMRAGLPQREPEALKAWNDNNCYEELMKHNEGKPLYILHDGPPYANGIIHMGTALNKSLKDFVVRYKNMTGYKAPYVPGYDMHGLPTELKARKAAGMKSSERISELELRKICHEFALKYAEEQRHQFERLGVLGEWDNPYMTLSNDYVAKQVEVFGEMANKGYIYKGLKPVYWCPECQTALAEAEIEYAEDPCYSIYVKFPVLDDKGVLSALGADLSKTYFVIWTTTTWTLPGNVAICVGPDYEYGVFLANGEYYVMAEELAKDTFAAAEIEEYKLLGTVKGAELEYIRARHPFVDRDSLVIVGDHVTLESGTGCVHTAPGYGTDDFEVCRNYEELPIVVTVDAKGVFTENAGQFAGLTTDEANKEIAKWLDANNYLFALKKIIHQYPHCWRCKSPILYRATEQWFCSISDFVDDAVKAIETVNWVPAWGEGRIKGMVRDRSDWCISRQRVWGVPIPIFYCKDCGKEVISPESIKKVADIFRKEGANAWYTHTAEELLPEGTVCECGCKEFTKETDIMDVWFDSGSSHAAVLETRDYLEAPADLYLEGADQYRGWFQSSLLTSVATRGVAPYKTVVTHGWVVDGEGKKMSKSIGNVIIPDDIVKQYGADILRLWVASSDYHADIRVSPEILKQLSEVYRKIRNTARFILGCISDFDPNTDCVTDDKFEEIDRFALYKLDNLVAECRKAYDNFEYHLIFHAIHNFCVLDMSNFYLDVLKDRLYVDKADSVSRRAAQTAMYRILDTLTRLVSPILAFTSDEIWQFMPHDSSCDTRNVIFNDMPTAKGVDDEAFMARWSKIFALREDVKKVLETARAEKVIGASLDASVTLYAKGEEYAFLEGVLPLLKSVFIVSNVTLIEGEGGAFTGDLGIGITAAHAEGEKCERCWSYSETVGKDGEHKTLCARCAAVIKSL